MRSFRFAIAILWCAAAWLSAAPEPDTLLFTNGEKLIGHFVRSDGSKVTFRSDMAGEITVDWSKVRELRSSQRFAVVPKGVRLGRHDQLSKIPQGTVTVAEQKIEVKTAEGQPPLSLPVAESSQVIDMSTFDRAILNTPNILEGWKGAVTAGAALVEATQHSRTFTGALTLTRPIPAETWLKARDRTAISFSGAYGILTQPNTPRLKTEIFHADAERDEYFTNRFFGFAQITFDHNFSQALDLQQNYGGGVGWSVIKKPTEALDLKVSLSYVRQRFQQATQDQDLVGWTFAEGYSRRFRGGANFAQQISITPTSNNLSAYVASGNMSFTMPLYKRLNFTTGVVENFLNNPQPGFRKNSFQLTTGLTYSLR